MHVMNRFAAVWRQAEFRHAVYPSSSHIAPCLRLPSRLRLLSAPRTAFRKVLGEKVPLQ
jgi:hypothetical protein